MEPIVVHQHISNDILKTSVVSAETGEIYGQETYIRPSFAFYSVIESTLDDAIQFAERAGYQDISIDSPFYEPLLKHLKMLKELREG